MSQLRDHLPSYRAALRACPDATRDLSKNTRSRYRNAAFPGAVRWLLRNPALLRALADDAERGEIPAELLTDSSDLVAIPS